MLIRSETPTDYTAITTLHIRAFGERLGEALIVMLLRERPLFDPELSLVAEVDGRVVGHALFSPYTIRLLGENVRAVNLAPLGVEPAYQRQGIGGALLEEGHQRARAKGCTVSFLLGHDTYYPRFGYRTGMFGVSSLRVNAASLPQSALPFEKRQPREADIPALRALWLHEEGQVDFAIEPGDTLLDWLSPNPGIEARVYVRNGEVVGYVRVPKDKPGEPRLFLAADQVVAREMAAELAAFSTTAVLPLHPYSASAFEAPRVQAWNAGMALGLLPSPFDEFAAQVVAGRRAPGRVIWTTPFDLG